MTCREALPLLPLFFDGELDARQMRAVALHSSRCRECETEIRTLERLQELVSDTLHARADDLDLTGLWSSVAARLEPARRGWWQRAVLWWSEHEGAWAMRWPAVGAAVAAALLAVFAFMRAQQPAVQPAARQVAAVDNAAMIDSLDTDLDSVAETRTTVLWVSDDTVIEDVPWP